MHGERRCYGRGSNATAVCDTLTSQRKGSYVRYGVWGMILALSDLPGVSGINHECVFLKLQQQCLRSLLWKRKLVNAE